MDEKEQQNFEKQIGVEPSPDGQTPVATEEQSPPTPKPSHTKLIIGIIAVFLLVAGSVGAYFFVSQRGDVEQRRTDEQQNELVVSKKKELETVKYLLRYGYDLPEEGRTLELYDAELIALKSDGTEVVLVPSVKELIPELNDDFNKTLTKISAYSDPNILFFGVVFADTDAGVEGVYKYNITEKVFSISTIGLNFPIWNYKDRTLWSSNNQYMLSTLGESFDSYDTLYLLNFLDDSTKAIAVVGVGETLASSCVYFGRSPADIEWIDDSKIKYGVYADGTCEEEGVSELIEHRIVNIRGIDGEENASNTVEGLGVVTDHNLENPEWGAYIEVKLENSEDYVYIVYRPFEEGAPATCDNVLDGDYLLGDNVSFKGERIVGWGGAPFEILQLTTCSSPDYYITVSGGAQR